MVIGHVSDAILFSTDNWPMESSTNNSGGLPQPPRESTSNGAMQDMVACMLRSFDSRMTNLETKIGEIHEILRSQRTEKEWYTTGELAEALGKSQFTVQERWCNGGRIDCEKDSESGKWRIPGDEYRRLVAGGELRKPKPR
jgi:hypothetical protein